MLWKTGIGNDCGRITAAIRYNKETRDETNLGQFQPATNRQSPKSAPFSSADTKRIWRILSPQFAVPNNRSIQNPSKSLKKKAFEAKGRQNTAIKVIQRLFNIDLNTY